MFIWFATLFIIPIKMCPDFAKDNAFLINDMSDIKMVMGFKVPKI